MANPKFNSAAYLGGFPGAPKAHNGPLEFGTGTVIVAGLRKALVTVQVPAIVSVEIASEQAAKSRVGAVALFGVAGLAAKGSTTNTIVTLHMQSGAIGIFRIDKTDPATVRAKLAPWVAATTVTWHGEQMTTPPPAASVSDELGRLAELHRSGALTPDEFIAAKARLLQ